MQDNCKIDKKLANLGMLSPKNIAARWVFSGLADQLNQKHPLYLLADKINRPLFDEAFKKYYSEKMGAPAKPIRLMVSLLILKYVRNLSNENLVEQWSENNYFQYFSGEQFFQPKIPCVPTELVAFCQRIGSVDTTVQEKNITYSTDDKLYKKIITKCWKIADKEKIDLRQSNTKTFKSSAMNNGSREQNMVQKQLGKLISYYYSESTSSQLIKMLSLKIVSYRNSKSESITSIF